MGIRLVSEAGHLRDMGCGVAVTSDSLRRFALSRVVGARRRPLWQDASVTAGVVIGEVAVGCALDRAGSSDGSIAVVYVLGIFFLSASVTRRVFRPVGMVVLLLAFDLLYVSPRLSLAAPGASELGLLAAVLVVGVVLSFLVVQLRDALWSSQATSRRLRTLLETERQLQGCHDLDAIVSGTGQQLATLLERSVLWYPEGTDGLGSPVVFGDEGSVVVEQAVAQRAYANGSPTGVGTEAFASAQGVYLPLSCQGHVVGVVGILEGDQSFSDDERREALSVLGEASLALERNEALEQGVQANRRAQEQQRRASLLRSVSHDLRTPLTSISGSAEMILDGGEALDSTTRDALAQGIYDDAVWLHDMVENLLAVTRIQEGGLQIDAEPQLVDEMVEEALRHVSRKVERHELVVVAPDGVVLVRADARMVVQVIVNLVNNAVEHTPDGSRIEIRYGAFEGMGRVRVEDDGPGVPDDEKALVFEAFHSGRGVTVDSKRNAGLGLSLCKTIVEAQGGRIWVEDVRPHGVAFVFTLPLEEVPGNAGDEG